MPRTLTFCTTDVSTDEHTQTLRPQCQRHTLDFLVFLGLSRLFRFDVFVGLLNWSLLFLLLGSMNQTFVVNLFFQRRSKFFGLQLRGFWRREFFQIRSGFLPFGSSGWRQFRCSIAEVPFMVDLGSRVFAHGRLGCLATHSTESGHSVQSLLELGGYPDRRPEEVDIAKPRGPRWDPTHSEDSR